MDLSRIYLAVFGIYLGCNRCLQDPSLFGNQSHDDDIWTQLSDELVLSQFLQGLVFIKKIVLGIGL